MATTTAGTIDCSAPPLDLSFHPTNPNILAAGLVDGTVELHDLKSVGNKNKDEKSYDHDDTILSSIPVHTMKISSDGQKKKISPSCRALLFSQNNSGEQLFTGGSSSHIACLQTERASSLGASEEACISWRLGGGGGADISRLHQLPNSAPCGPLLCSGDEDGCIQLWDTRLTGANGGSNKKACVASYSDNTDYISGFTNDIDGTTLLASCADCSLSVLDLRKIRGPQRKEAFRKSDDQEDEMLSLQIIKNGRKIVCGSQQGVLSVWSWGIWGDVSDRFPGHPASIDALLKVDEDTLLTGSSDGLIRLVQIHPDKLLGVLGEHDGYPVERMQFNADRRYVGSISHDNLIRLWNANVLEEGYDEDEEKEDVKALDEKIGIANTTKHDSDDDWDDEDDDEDDDKDSEDSDDSDEEEETANEKRAKRLKTANDVFFEDL